MFASILCFCFCVLVDTTSFHKGDTHRCCTSYKDMIKYWNVNNKLTRGYGCVKKIIIWTVSALILMIGLPWIAVTFAGSAGMAICFLLFFVINPLYAAVCGAFAGRNIKQLWALPVITSVLFLAGSWLFFEMGENVFWLYCGCYLIIGVIAMLISFFINKRKWHPKRHFESCDLSVIIKKEHYSVSNNVLFLIYQYS